MLPITHAKADKTVQIRALAREGMGLLPLVVNIHGRRADLILRTFDRLFGRSLDKEVRTKYGTISIDADHAPERLIAYAFHNLMLAYSSSPLGKYLALRTKGPAGATFVDVGANLGLYSLYAKSLGYRTVLFEPEPKHAQFLMRNSALFGLVYPIALSNVDGVSELHIHSTNSGGSSLFSRPMIYSRSVTVKTSSFSHAIELSQISPSDISFVKIDVEGAEFFTVLGMCEFLKNGWRPQIWCEVRGGGHYGHYRHVCEFLQGFDYIPFIFDGRALKQPQFEHLESIPTFDFLFICSNRAGEPRLDMTETDANGC
jgi:FkbM family methyltransferase